MLSLFRRVVVSNSFRCFYVRSCKIFPSNLKCNNSCPVNYSSVAAKVICLTRINRLPTIFAIDTRLQHQQSKTRMSDIGKYESLLKKIVEEDELSVIKIRFYSDRVTSLFEDLSFETDHERMTLEHQAFWKLFTAVNDSISQMSIDDLMSVLPLCGTFCNNVIHIKILEKLQGNCKALKFFEKVKLWESYWKLRSTKIKEIRDLENEIQEDIKQKLHLDSSDNIAYALAYMQKKIFFDMEAKKEVMFAVLDLKTWDHGHFYQYFLHHYQTLNPSVEKDINGRYLKRIKQNLITSNCYFLHHFLLSYSQMVKGNRLAYDKNLIDDVVSKCLDRELKITEITSIVNALFKLRHSHYGFVEHLINFLRDNPDVFSSHSILSAKVVEYIADCNCNGEELNRWSKIQHVLRNNPKLFKTTEFFRRSVDSYINFLKVLASLEIFIDQELMFLYGFLFEKYFRKFEKYYVKMVYISEMTRAYHPSYSHSNLISCQDISRELEILLKKFSSSSISDRFLSVKDIGKQLDLALGATNCFLPVCFKKSGYLCDGLLAVNDNGKFYDFGEKRDKKKIIFIEDVFVPPDFKLMTLVLVSEKDCSRNTLDLKVESAMRLKIQEASGYPTAVIYTNVLNSLNDDEKKDYLRDKIFKKILPQKITNDYLPEKKIVKM